MEAFAARGRLMATGAHEATTGDELQLRSAGVGGGSLTPGVIC